MGRFILNSLPPVAIYGIYDKHLVHLIRLKNDGFFSSTAQELNEKSIDISIKENNIIYKAFLLPTIRFDLQVLKEFIKFGLTLGISEIEIATEIAKKASVIPTIFKDRQILEGLKLLIMFGKVKVNSPLELINMITSKPLNVIQPNGDSVVLSFNERLGTWIINRVKINGKEFSYSKFKKYTADLLKEIPLNYKQLNDYKICPICGRRIKVKNLARHVNMHLKSVNSAIPKRLKYKFNKIEISFIKKLAKIEGKNETIIDIVELYSFSGYLVTNLYINGEKYFLEGRPYEVISQIKEYL